MTTNSLLPNKTEGTVSLSLEHPNWQSIDNYIYIEQRQLVMKLLRIKRMDFHGNQVKENLSNARIIFGTVNKLFQRHIEKPLPKHKLTSELAEEFSAFFANKVSTVHQCLGSSCQDTVDIEFWCRRWGRSTEDHQHILTYVLQPESNTNISAQRKYYHHFTSYNQDREQVYNIWLLLFNL